MKARKKRFLGEHPICCFCGGKTPAAEGDHIPSRVCFDFRQWPEGFEFPACVKCNRETRHAEQVVAMLARMYPDPTTSEAIAELEERVRAVNHNYPGVLEEMRPTLQDLQTAQSKYGVQIPLDGSTAPILRLKGPLIAAAVEEFSRKLFCALYYKHTATILPANGEIAVKWETNLQIDTEGRLRQLESLLPGIPKLERARTSLGDQFSYRFGLSATKAAAGFLAFFRGSFAILGYVSVSGVKFKLADDARILKPYSWN
jgi:hypothetical protein